MENFPGSPKYEAIHWDIMMASYLMDLLEKNNFIFFGRFHAKTAIVIMLARLTFWSSRCAIGILMQFLICHAATQWS